MAIYDTMSKLAGWGVIPAEDEKEMRRANQPQRRFRSGSQGARYNRPPATHPGGAGDVGFQGALGGFEGEAPRERRGFFDELMGGLENMIGMGGGGTFLGSGITPMIPSTGQELPTLFGENIVAPESPFQEYQADVSQKISEDTSMQDLLSQGLASLRDQRTLDNTPAAALANLFGDTFSSVGNLPGSTFETQTLQEAAQGPGGGQPGAEEMVMTPTEQRAGEGYGRIDRRRYPATAYMDPRWMEWYLFQQGLEGLDDYYEPLDYDDSYYAYPGGGSFYGGGGGGGGGLTPADWWQRLARWLIV